MCKSKTPEKMLSEKLLGRQAKMEFSVRKTPKLKPLGFSSVFEFTIKSIQGEKITLVNFSQIDQEV